MAKRRSKEPVEKVGNYEFTIRFAESSTPEADERWTRRSDALFAWLMEQWNREQAAKTRQAGEEPLEPNTP